MINKFLIAKLSSNDDLKTPFYLVKSYPRVSVFEVLAIVRLR